MQLTMMGEYALRTMTYICTYPAGTVFQISDIAEKNEVPESFLRKIVPMLCKGKMLQSTRGSKGGIKLLKSGDEITPLMIIECVEGEISLNKCMIGKEYCSNDNWCSVHILWSGAQKMLRDKLSSTTMAILAKENSERFSAYHKQMLTIKQSNKKE